MNKYARAPTRTGAGALVTIALVPVSSRRLEAAGFKLQATYRVPGVGLPGASVYAQIALRDESDEPQMIDSARVFDRENAQLAMTELPLLPALDHELTQTKAYQRIDSDPDTEQA